MNQITNPPNQYGFGLEFNYAVWTQDTQITLCNVPWNNDYRDIVSFKGRPTLNAYINSLETEGVVLSNLSYVKPNEPIRVPIPFNAAYKYNYLRASNPLQPIGGDVLKDFYYFITDVRYIAPNTTEIVVQLDVWTTFGFDAKFGNCYVERGHIGVANQHAFDNYGRDYLTIAEGLDTGSEMVTINQIANMGMNTYDVLVVSTIDLAADPGTLADPQLNSASGQTAFGMPSGANQYLFRGIGELSLWLAENKDKTWVTQGIISIAAVPVVSNFMANVQYSTHDNLQQVNIQSVPPYVTHMLQGWRDIVTNGYLPARYAKLKKFWTAPYMMCELTFFSGSPLMLNPESWNDPDANVAYRTSVTPPNQRLIASPLRYNSSGVHPTLQDPKAGLPDGGDDWGDYLDVSTVMAALPTFATVNNQSLMAMASNAHSIQYQRNQADWSQQKALGSNQVSYDQASTGMQLANELTGIGTGAATAQTNLANQVATSKAIVGGVADVAGGAAAGMVAGPAGAIVGAAGGLGAAVVGGIGTAIDEGARSQSTAIGNNAARRSTRASNTQAGYVRDTNRQLADWAAKGDYAMNIAGINAKLRDTMLTPPSVAGQVGGDALNIASGNAVLSFRVKMIDQARIRAIGEFWLRYGYAVNQFARMPDNFMVMNRFTYWKLSETYISSSMMPESFKQIIRGIFEKGVTVWADPLDIGNIDIAENSPLDGITL